jgi:long-chain-fatty-acid--CoA ligase ACSBG
MFFGVPRVYEKMQEKLMSIINSTRGIKLSLLQWARRVATVQINQMFKGRTTSSFEFNLAKTLVLNKIKSSLGLSSCKQVYCGAAPIRKDTLEFFVSLGIPLCEVFGMSETTSAHIFGLANSNRLGSVGRITRLNKSKIASPDANGCGELCISSRAVFMGYLNNLEKSKECFDDDGWLRTGGISFFNF